MIAEVAFTDGKPTGSAFPCRVCGWYSVPDQGCCKYSKCPTNEQAPTAAANSEEENQPMSMIDERQIEVLDAFRDARDVAKRHAQSKVDRATLMKIQAEALIAESKELVAELNEEIPIPGESGSPIGPIPGAGGGIR